MADYFLKGYTPPATVTNRDQVRQLQQQLGVTADGIWGPKTQAAYNQQSGGQSANYSPASGGAVTSKAYGANVTTPSGRRETTFTPSYSLSDAPGAGQTKGIFSSAAGRQYGDIQHASGYSGKGYKDARGRYYTDYGALLRDDGFFYQPGAKISPNGMYEDTGGGMTFAKYGAHYPDGTNRSKVYVPSDRYGPGEVLPFFDDLMKTTPGTPAGTPAGTPPATPAAPPAAAIQYDDEWLRYMRQQMGY